MSATFGFSDLFQVEVVSDQIVTTQEFFRQDEQDEQDKTSSS
jgi:hypothetical protein